MQNKPKINQLNLIIAKKGAGKSIFALGLALAQNKKVFWITPIKNGYTMLPCDTLKHSSVTTPPHLSITYLECDRENIEPTLTRIQTISANMPNGVFLVIDELDYYANSRLNYKSNIFEIINYGRHLNLDITFIARRVQDIPKNAVSNIDYFYLGKNNNIVNDEKYYKDFLKNDIIETSKLLQRGQFIKYNANADMCEILQIKPVLVSRIENARKN